ncbi:cytochrome P450 4d8-like isoform X1 [Musca autumnalis]|uniref:cytochrome P450 4d8-like isoform X1 n=2 Tax=Musca autumnalis TaxID=221902 RepID=UPI003CEF5AAC
MLYFTLILIFLIILIFIWALRIHISTKYSRILTDHIPGPHCYPILGCVGEAIKINPDKFLEATYEARDKYGSIIKIWMLNRLFICTSNIELYQQILATPTQISKSCLYTILKQWLGTGLLMSDGQKWHTRRKIITPTFHFTILEQFIEVFDRQSTVLLDCLAERADGKTPFDIMPYICSAAMDIITETAMGVNVNAQTDKNMPYTMAVKEMTSLSMWRFIRTYLNDEIVFSILHPFKKLRQNKLIKIMHKFTRSVIEERRRELEKRLKSKENITDHDPHGIGMRKHMALMDVLLQATTADGVPLSDEDIREEVDTFMFEGHDTTTTALCFTLYLISRHPEVQQKLLDEIYDIFGKRIADPFTITKLNELKYMECVIKESLRLYPPVPIIGREITEDFHYTHSEIGDGVLPAGTQLMMYIFHGLRDESVFHNPTEFIPDRHRDSSINSPFIFVPFSAGSRNCIGQRFAMLEMKTVLCKILREYELLPLGPDIKRVLGIILRSETGMQLGIKKRATT